MGIMKWLGMDRKNSATNSVTYMHGVEAYSTGMVNDEKIAKEGYKENTIVYKCIDLISSSASKIPFVVKNQENEVQEDHPASSILSSPNKAQGGNEFLKSVYSNYELYGNSFIEANGDKNIKVNQPPTFLYVLSPTKTKVIPGENFNASEYIYKGGKGSLSYPVTIDGKSNVLHVKTYNPTSPYIGMSPIIAAAYQVDLFNESARWNNSLLRNSGRPSGMLNVKGDMSPEERVALEDKLNRKHSGADNAGRVMLSGGAEYEWMPFGLTPKDMDYLNSLKSSAHFISLVYNVPMDLLNTEQAKFDNLNAANELLFDNAVQPLVEQFADEFTRWLLPRYEGSEGLKIVPDYSNVSAIMEKKARKIQSLEPITYMTINEKRAQVGLDPIDGGDELLVDLNKIPLSESGQGLFQEEEKSLGCGSTSELIKATYGDN